MTKPKAKQAFADAQADSFPAYLPDNPAEIKLLNRVREGDIEALATYFHQFRHLLTGYATFMNLDAARSEDVVQDSFLTIFKMMSHQKGWNPENFESPYQIKKLIKSCVRQRALNIMNLAYTRYETPGDVLRPGGARDSGTHAYVIDTDSHLSPDVYDTEPLTIMTSFDLVASIKALDHFVETQIQDDRDNPVHLLADYISASVASDETTPLSIRSFAKQIGMNYVTVSRRLIEAQDILSQANLGHWSWEKMAQRKPDLDLDFDLV